MKHFETKLASTDFKISFKFQKNIFKLFNIKYILIKKLLNQFKMLPLHLPL